MSDPKEPNVKEVVDTSVSQSAKKKVKRISRSTYRQFGEFDLLFDSLLNDPEAKQLAKGIGVDDAAIKAGQSLWEKAHASLEARNIAKGRLQMMVQSLQTLRTEVKAEYMQHRKFIRIAYKKDEGMLKTLEVSGNAKEDLNSLRFRMEAFYNAVLAEEAAKAALLANNVSEKALKDMQKWVGELTALEHDREQLAAEAKNLTIAKNRDMEELGFWVNNFRQRARARYFQDPQARNILGL